MTLLLPVFFLQILFCCKHTLLHFFHSTKKIKLTLTRIRMNGNWGGIASRDFERMRADDHGAHGGGGGEYDPSLDVINTIVSICLIVEKFTQLIFLQL